MSWKRWVVRLEPWFSSSKKMRMSPKRARGLAEETWWFDEAELDIQYLTGWWFGIFVFFNILGRITTTDYFSKGFKPPTSQRLREWLTPWKICFCWFYWGNRLTDWLILGVHGPLELLGLILKDWSLECLHGGFLPAKSSCLQWRTVVSTIPWFIAGWWWLEHLTCIFPYGNVIIPIDELIFFRGVVIPPTR